MLTHPVDIYYNTPPLVHLNEASGEYRVFSFLEGLYANNTVVPWEQWFAERPDELNHMVGNLQCCSSYHLYAEHLLAGMPYWNIENLTHKTHVEMLLPLSGKVAESTWHALGQRENGDVMKHVIAAVYDATLQDLMSYALTQTPHGAAIGFYNGFLQKELVLHAGGEYSSEFYVWCKRMCQQHLPLTKALFLERYPEAGFLWALNALQLLPNLQEMFHVEDDIKQWRTEQPLQGKALYACLMHTTGHYWQPPSTPWYDDATQNSIRAHAEIINSLFSEKLSVSAYIQLYVRTFNKPFENHESSLNLPSDFQI